ncbi:photosystem II reaction center protein T [Lyngbya confervoides]|uniref:Photosystem II reaction center protein T n=1 Tax=Lyngbya confervoides BDU141951 TaxID=1574623 RepID=A0ABD4T9U2_9CYAN|nr:photosystem II reaction center protein T [Lyngbya confervoides]MCM1985200.1 photosystem II reaction center protein T [Lyngbya confervoides BDU141951]
MESIAYVFIFACILGVLFFAIFFREPPKITKD